MTRSPASVRSWNIPLGWTLGIALAVAALAILPQFAGRFVLGLVLQISVLAAFAYSYQLLFGCAGMLSFGHAVYFGLGAFAAAHGMNSPTLAAVHFPTELVPMIGTIVGFAACVVFGYPSSRRTGTPFAMVTLGIGELVAACFLMFPGFFGGEAGISTDRAALAGLLTKSYGRAATIYPLVIGWAVLFVAVALWLAKTPLGLLARAGRDNTERLAFLGHEPAATRFRVMLLASAMAGGAGALSAVVYEIVSVESVGLTASANVLLMTVVGGTANLSGPLVGAVVLTLMQTVLSQATPAWNFYYGLLFIVVVLFAPRGLAGLAVTTRDCLRRDGLGAFLRSSGRPIVACVALAASTIAVVEALFSRGHSAGASSGSLAVALAASIIALGSTCYLVRFMKGRLR